MQIEGSIRQKCWEFYFNYEGEKVMLSTFYQKARKYKDKSLEELIKPEPKIYKPRHNGVFATELYWYEDQLEPKATKGQFNNRLRMGFPKEQAILTGEPRNDLLIMREKQRTRTIIQPTPHKPTYSRFAKDEDDDIEPDYYRIEITYPKEVADVFRNEYLDLIRQTKKEIEDIEQVLLITEERIEEVEGEKERKKLLDRLDLLEAQLNIFNSYNK